MTTFVSIPRLPQLLHQRKIHFVIAFRSISKEHVPNCVDANIQGISSKRSYKHFKKIKYLSHHFRILPFTILLFVMF